MQDVIIEFGRQHDLRSVLAEGWAGAEPTHRWTLGAESALLLGPLAARTQVLLKLDVFPHLPPGLTAQRLAVAVNGMPLAAFVLDRPDVLTCVVPAGLLRQDTANRIEFRHPDAARPCDFAAASSDDARPLAVGFRTVHLQEIGGIAEAGGAARRLVLLTGFDEARSLRPLFADASFEVKDVQSRAALEAVLQGDLSQTRLLAYCSAVIVPEPLLRRLPGPSYNIHPGPPDYPGADPCAWGAYDGCRRFAATLHEMTTRVDDGPIVDIGWFDVPEGAGHADFARRAREAAIALLRRWRDALAGSTAPLPHLGQDWGPRRTTRRLTEAMRRIPPTIDATELERRRRAFADLPGEHLVVTLHGRDFVG